MLTKAFAKINLSLDVTERRDDGFHTVRSVMHSVSLCDELNFEFESSDAVSITVTSNVSALESRDNLVYRAALMYMVRCKIIAKVNIHLKKSIPVGAGLGGGSSDAAATLRAFNKHFGCLSEEQIFKMCAEIGSDVPFCYSGGTALCEGRGEIITPIQMNKKMHFVISIGSERISTPKAFKALDEKFSNFDGSVKSVDYSQAPELILNEKNAIKVYNIFEEIIYSEATSVLEIKAILYESGAKYALMTGSGPAVFGVFSSENDARFAEKKLNSLGFSAFYAQSV